MNEQVKLSATRAIWIAFFMALVVTNANVVFWAQTPGVANVIMTVIIGIATTATSIAIWTSQSPFDNGETDEAKLKRGERVKRLIDLMDDDELYELRERLSTDYTEQSDNYVVLGTDGELHRKKPKVG